MKILLFIDHLGSGGAQRQITMLAEGLSERSHDVELLTYWPSHGFFRSRLNEAGIVEHRCDKKPGFDLRVSRHLHSLCKRERYDVVISFLDSPNLYAELAFLRILGTRLIVSERSSHENDPSFLEGVAKRLMHAMANHIVANSTSHASWMTRRHFWLRNRVSTIYNGVRLPLSGAEPLVPARPKDVKLIAIGRVTPAKNAATLIRALKLFHAAEGWIPRICWVGRREDATLAHQQNLLLIEAELANNPEIESRWEWLGERSDIWELLDRHHALIHPSYYEGLPNAVCESLAAGRPVLVSNVCDNPLLVASGERGFLFDPSDPRTIASAMKKLCEQSSSDWVRMSRNAREYSEQSLSVESFIESYDSLSRSVARARS